MKIKNRRCGKLVYFRGFIHKKISEGNWRKLQLEFTIQVIKALVRSPL
jgi:hypothetical protein